jgi:hypothetical protein
LKNECKIIQDDCESSLRFYKLYAEKEHCTVMEIRVVWGMAPCSVVTNVSDELTATSINPIRR